MVKSDQLAGSVVGLKGKLPQVWYEFEIEPHLLERVVGSKEELKVEPIKLGELLMLNVNSAATVGQITQLAKNKIKCKLKIPVCTEVGSRITISRRIGNRFRLIGYGIIH
jgi:translation initiation factor 2 subunit 3